METKLECVEIETIFAGDNEFSIQNAMRWQLRPHFAKTGTRG